jgi:hypothetical protein
VRVGVFEAEVQIQSPFEACRSRVGETFAVSLP